jgi:hypothetical protein
MTDEKNASRSALRAEDAGLAEDLDAPVDGDEKLARPGGAHAVGRHRAGLGERRAREARADAERVGPCERGADRCVLRRRRAGVRLLVEVDVSLGQRSRGPVAAGLLLGHDLGGRAVDARWAGPRRTDARVRETGSASGAAAGRRTARRDDERESQHDRTCVHRKLATPADASRDHPDSVWMSHTPDAAPDDSPPPRGGQVFSPRRLRDAPLLEREPVADGDVAAGPRRRARGCRACPELLAQAGTQRFHPLARIADHRDLSTVLA